MYSGRQSNLYRIGTTVLNEVGKGVTGKCRSRGQEAAQGIWVYPRDSGGRQHGGLKVMQLLWIALVLLVL